MCNISGATRNMPGRTGFFFHPAAAAAQKEAERDTVMHIGERKVLVVEDDAAEAEEIVTLLRSVGAEVLGPAQTLDEAMAHCERAEAAVLEVQIGGAHVFPVADALAARDIPLVFYTGCRHIEMPPRFRLSQCLAKPASAGATEVAVGSVLIRREPDLAGVLSQMRLVARLVIRDPAAADRLVERTLRAAITPERPAVHLKGRSARLFELMGRIHDQHRQGRGLLH